MKNKKLIIFNKQKENGIYVQWWLSNFIDNLLTGMIIDDLLTGMIIDDLHDDNQWFTISYDHCRMLR